MTREAYINKWAHGYLGNWRALSERDRRRFVQSLRHHIAMSNPGTEKRVSRLTLQLIEQETA